MWVDCEPCQGSGKTHSAGLFYLFQVQTIDYVVKGDEQEEDLARLEKRGIRLVNVVPVEEVAPCHT